MEHLPSVDPNWVIGRHGLLCLRAVRRHGRTEIDPVRRRVPYQWQGSHYQDHDDQPFVLLHNSAGGFVEGDVAELRVDADKDARLLLTTTSATKFYKCEEGLESVDLVDIDLAPGSVLEYVPDEVIPFARSKVVRRTRLRLDVSSRLFLSDILAAGRVGSGEGFAFASLRLEFELWIGGSLVVLDRLLVSDLTEVEALASLWAGHKYLATVFAYAPDLAGGIEQLVAERAEALEGVTAGTTRRDQLLSTRILAHEAWQAHEAVNAVWDVLRPAVAGKAARPVRK